MYKIEAFAEVHGDKPGTKCGGWQQVAVVHHVATAEKIAINHRQDTGALTRVRAAHDLTIGSRHGEICKTKAQALTAAQELTPAEYAAELGEW
jgi:hypothetical protein